MAGTIVADTIQDGTGNTTAMTNAISGSAKAWARFSATVSSVTINQSYNISSIAYNAVGDYTVNFSTTLTDANYSMVSSSYSASDAYPRNIMFKNGTTPTSSSCRVTNSTSNAGSTQDSAYMSIIFIR